MLPEHYTFDAPIVMPKPPLGQGRGFLDVIRSGDSLQLSWVAPKECPLVVHAITGERGRLIRGLTNDIRELPKFGKVTLIFQRVIAVENSDKVYGSWDPKDWQVHG